MHHQGTWPLAFLQAEWILMLADCTSASIPSAKWYIGVLVPHFDINLLLYVTSACLLNCCESSFVIDRWRATFILLLVAAIHNNTCMVSFFVIKFIIMLKLLQWHVIVFDAYALLQVDQRTFFIMDALSNSRQDCHTLDIIVLSYLLSNSLDRYCSTYISLLMLVFECNAW